MKSQIFTNQVFQRIEKKYLLNEKKYNTFLNLIDSYMQLDQYGLHTICNIYYDTDEDILVQRSIEKPVYKEKLRLRSYGIPNDNNNVFLEIKKKYEDIVYKRRVSMTLKEAEYYLKNKIKPKKENQILKELDYFIQFYNPKPKLYIAYDRKAYYGKEDNDIRMTFDTNIRSRKYDLWLDKGDYGDLLLEEKTYLLEIKVPAAYPLWLSKILSELEIYPTSFSKYGIIYKKNMMENMERLERVPICSRAS